MFMSKKFKSYKIKHYNIYDPLIYILISYNRHIIHLFRNVQYGFPAWN